MWYLRQVVGESMEPTLRPNQYVLCSHDRNFRVGDVVVAFLDGREVIKRITKKKSGQVFLEGDNADRSTDSRHHGWIVDTKNTGKVIWPRVSKRI